MRGIQQKHLPEILILVYFIVFFATACTTTQETELARQGIRKGEAAKTVGEAYLSQKNYTGALREFTKAVKVLPNDPYLHNNLGLTYQGKGRLDIAIEHFERSVALKPDLTPAINNLGSAYLLNQQWDKAIEVLNRITDDLLYATPHYPLALIGRAYFNKEEYPKAIEYFQKSLRYEPDYIFALNWLGRTYLMVGENSAAIEQFQKSIKLAPQFLETYFDIAIALQQSGQIRESFETYEKIQKLAPAGSVLKAEAAKRASKLPNF